MAISLKSVYRDGTEETKSIYSSDFVRYEREARRQGWGKPEESPFLANTYLMWSALYRDRATDLEYSEWLDTVDVVQSVDEEEDDRDAGFPQTPQPMA